jgi:hypothetical protein
MDKKNESGVIYMFTTPHSDKVFIRGTNNTPQERLKEHRKDYRRSGSKRYITSYEIFEQGENEVQIIVLEQWISISRRQMKERERYFIDMYKDRCVNVQRYKFE